MSTVKQYAIIYSIENQENAEKLSLEISEAGYSVEMHARSEADYASRISSIKPNGSSQIVILISDNFLKSAGCMHGILQAAHTWGDENRLIPVVTDGIQYREDGTMESVPTSFDRVNHIIQYMNFWQEAYLELRKEKRADGAMSDKVTIVKEISGEVGEFLRYVRGMGYFEFEDYLDILLQRKEDDVKPAHSQDEERWDPEYESVPGQVSPADDRYLIEMIEQSSEDLIAENRELEGTPGEDLDDPLEQSEEDVEEEYEEDLLEEIPGMDLLRDKGTQTGRKPAVHLDQDASVFDDIMSEDEEEDEDSGEWSPSVSGTQQSGDRRTGYKNLDEENEELMSILEEVLEEEDTAEAEDRGPHHFSGSSPEESDDFDLDALFDEPDEQEETAGTTGFPAMSTVEEEDFGQDLLLDIVEEEEAFVLHNGSRFSVESVLHRADDLLQRGSIEKGIRYLREIAGENPENDTIHYYFAYVLARYADDYFEARNELEQLLKRDPTHADAWFLMGELAENQDDPAGASKCFSRVADLSPHYPEVWHRLGLLSVQNDPIGGKEAANFFKKALKEDEYNIDARYMLGSLLYERLGKPEKAVKQLKKVLEIFPSHPFANYDLALIYYQWGDMNKASAYYRAAIANNAEIQTRENDEVFGHRTADRQEATGSDERTIRQKTDNLTEKAHQPASLSSLEEPRPESTDVEEDTASRTESVSIQSDSATKEQNMKEESASHAPVILITGGTSGIGKATAHVFAENGYRVIITGRRKDRLEDLALELRERYQADIYTLPFDVRDAAAVGEALDHLPDTWKKIDILINNAGLSRGLDPIQSGQLEDWETMIDTNIKGLLYVTRAIAPGMVARRKGHIINLASSAAKEVYPGGNVYCATKSAVEALTKSMRLDLYTYQIRVSQVAPGHVEETEFASVRFGGDQERAQKVYENFQPLKSSDVARVIFFIASQPAHVNIQDVFMFGTQQAGSNFIDRSGR